MIDSLQVKEQTGPGWFLSKFGASPLNGYALSSGQQPGTWSSVITVIAVFRLRLVGVLLLLLLAVLMATTTESGAKGFGMLHWDSGWLPMLS